MDPIALGQVYTGAPVVGLLIGLFWLLATGRLATGREMREKDATIAAQRKLLETRDAQHTLLLQETLPTVATVLEALRVRAEEKR